MPRPKPVVLVTMSGIGVSPTMDGNALRQAKMPTLSRLIETYPAVTLHASGPAVGLEEGYGGNAQAGHRAIGLGTAWFASAPRVADVLARGVFSQTPVLRRLVRHVASSRGTVHVVTLLSSAEWYARQDTLEALIALFIQEKIPARLHIILDGIDAPRERGKELIDALESRLAQTSVQVGSVCGRRYGMDDLSHWEDTQLAFEAMFVARSSERHSSASEAVATSYARGVYDDEIVPTAIGPASPWKDGDAVIFCHTRPFAIRQLVGACVLPEFSAFDRAPCPDIFFASIVEIDKDYPMHVCFPALLPEVCLGRCFADAGLRQLRVAETERFAHVTVFLNGMQEDPFPGEDRMIISSPLVSSYDQAPGMSMEFVADAVVKAVAEGHYDVIIANLAAPDIVARSGSEDATVRACEVMDHCLGRMVEAVFALDGAIILVGDRGRVEALYDPATGRVRRRGTMNPVPCVIASHAHEGLKAVSGDAVGGDLGMTSPAGALVDIAPTILKLMELPIPKEMTGRALM